MLDNTNDQRGQALNAELRALIPLLDATYGARIELFDAYNIIADIMKAPVTSGFLATSAFCAADAACYNNPSVANTYINWDGAHKTTAILRVLADQVVLQLGDANAVPLPGSLPLVLLALGTLVVVRRGEKREAGDKGPAPCRAPDPPYAKARS